MTDSQPTNQHNEATECRIVSYNVRYQGIDTDDRAWTNRCDGVVSTVRTLAPDVVAFQEVWLDQLPDLQSGLSEFAWVARDTDEQHTPIAYREERFTLLDWDTFWLSEPEAEPGVPGWDGTYQRLVTHATLREEETGRSIAVYSVHLDHEGRQARVRGVDLIRDHLSAAHPEGAVVVAGDFNCEPGSSAHDRAVDSTERYRHLVDTRRVAETVAGPEESYTGFEAGEGFETDEDDRVTIDHVLVTDGVSVERFETHVPETDDQPNPPSDHRPVVADLVFS
jgi:endonuclease/exonuclease/phosphatase family metal-dependent hydrolase